MNAPPLNQCADGRKQRFPLIRSTDHIPDIVKLLQELVRNLGARQVGHIVNEPPYAVGQRDLLRRGDCAIGGRNFNGGRAEGVEHLAPHLKPAALLCASIAQAQSDSSRKKHEEAAQTQQPTKADQRGTPEVQPVVQPLLSPLSQHQADDEASSEAEKAHFDRITAYSTFVIAFFTVALAWYTSRLFGSGERTFKHIERASHQQLRPYIGLSSFPLPSLPQGGTEIRAGVKIRNFGKTPAFNLESEIKCDIAPYPHPDGFVFDEGRAQPTVIELNPRDKTHVSKRGKLSAADVEQVRTGRDGIGEVRLYVHGHVRYTDAFGTVYNKRFCYIYGGKQGLKASSCPDHNDTIIEGRPAELTRWQLLQSWLCAKLDRNT